MQEKLFFLLNLQSFRKKLFLTFIGGGAFANPLDKIIAEIIDVHKRWTTHPECVIEKVVLIMYKPEPGLKVWLESMKLNGIPYSYVEYTAGKPAVVDSFDTN